jgi:hypothetical protein
LGRELALAWVWPSVVDLVSALALAVEKKIKEELMQNRDKQLSMME